MSTPPRAVGGARHGRAANNASGNAGDRAGRLAVAGGRPWRSLVAAGHAGVAPYAAALVASAAALLVALPLDPLIESSSLLFFLAAVAISAWYGGLGPGLLATAAGGIASTYFFLVPTYSFQVANLTAAVQLAVFVLVAFLTSSLSASLRQSRRREEAARTEAEAAQQRLTFLANASAALDTSLDYEETLHTLAALVVPTLADWCVVHVTVDEVDTVQRFAVAGGDPSNQPLMRTLRRQAASEDVTLRAVHEVLSTGRPVLRDEEIEDEPGSGAGEEDPHVRLLRSVGFRSVMIVPLVVAGRTFGAITLVSADSGRRYGPGELALAEDLAHRAALAINSARLYREAQEAVRGRDEVLAVASHDLRNPLASIKGEVQLLRRRSAASAPELASGLAQIESSTNRMVRLVAELLDIAYVQSGRRLELRLDSADLVALAKRLVRAHQVTSERHSIRLEADAPELVGYWDADRIERVVGNLIANAVKYSPDGGEVVVRVAREEDAEGAWGLLSVADRGIGIPEADLPRVFTRFFRASNVGQIRGHGIGLAGARQIVEQHAGSLTAESRPGAGSCFSLRLPLPVGAATAAQSPYTPDDSAGDGAASPDRDSTPGEVATGPSSARS